MSIQLSNLACSNMRRFGKLAVARLLMLGLSCAQPIELGFLMMARNERWNILEKLPAWKKTNNFDYFVVGIDQRTDDDTYEVIKEVLSDVEKVHVFYFEFTGFGPARNILLERARAAFPGLTHALMADPDWLPVEGTTGRGALEAAPPGTEVFSFRVYDKGQTTFRYVDWLFRVEGARFRYHLHEQLRTPGMPGAPTAHTGWEVRELPAARSWHTDPGEDAGHGGWRAAERFQFDYRMLEKDLAAYPGDRRTLYYLGVADLAYLERRGAEGRPLGPPEAADRAARGVAYLEASLGPEAWTNPRATAQAKAEGEEAGGQFAWLSARFLANAHWQFQNNTEKALKTYQLCIDMEPNLPDCYISKAQILFWEKKLVEAWEAVQGALQTAPENLQRRSFVHHTFHECMVPLVGAKVLWQLGFSGGFPGGKEGGGGRGEVWVPLGAALARNAERGCPPEGGEGKGELLSVLVHEGTELLPRLLALYAQRLDGIPQKYHCLDRSVFILDFNPRWLALPFCDDTTGGKSPGVESSSAMLFENVNKNQACNSEFKDLSSSKLDKKIVSFWRSFLPEDQSEGSSSLGSMGLSHQAVVSRLQQDLHQITYLISRGILPELLAKFVAPFLKTLLDTPIGTSHLHDDLLMGCTLALPLSLGPSALQTLRIIGQFFAPGPTGLLLFEAPPPLLTFALVNAAGISLHRDHTEVGLTVLHSLALSLETEQLIVEALYQSFIWDKVVEGHNQSACLVADDSTGLNQHMVHQVLSAVLESNNLGVKKPARGIAVRGQNWADQCETAVTAAIGGNEGGEEAVVSKAGYGEIQSQKLVLTVWFGGWCADFGSSSTQLFPCGNGEGRDRERAKVASSIIPGVPCWDATWDDVMKSSKDFDARTGAPLITIHTITSHCLLRRGESGIQQAKEASSSMTNQHLYFSLIFELHLDEEEAISLYV